jgi:hypothetical protein
MPYPCHNAVESAFVQQNADTCQAKVLGFTEAVGYYPTYEEQLNPSVKSLRQAGTGYNDQMREGEEDAEAMTETGQWTSISRRYFYDRNGSTKTRRRRRRQHDTR